MRWLDRLAEAEKKKLHNTTPHNTRERVGAHPTHPTKKNTNACGYRTDKRGQKGQGAAEEFGLCAAWSYEFGYISIHDPTSGEWYDLPTKDAPAWAKREAFKRKDLYRAGNRKAYRLTSREVEKIWEEETAPMWEQAKPAVTDKGIVYEDYFDNDHANEGQ